jgi:hypothetical protein
VCDEIELAPEENDFCHTIRRWDGRVLDASTQETVAKLFIDDRF